LLLMLGMVEGPDRENKGWGTHGIAIVAKAGPGGAEL
jgi:hypothetical protein